MSDFADEAAAEQDIHLTAALHVRKPSLPITGHCHNCGEPVQSLTHFCDADCRDDYERRMANKVVL